MFPAGNIRGFNHHDPRSTIQHIVSWLCGLDCQTVNAIASFGRDSLISDKASSGAESACWPCSRARESRLYWPVPPMSFILEGGEGAALHSHCPAGMWSWRTWLQARWVCGQVPLLTIAMMDQWLANAHRGWWLIIIINTGVVLLIDWLSTWPNSGPILPNS